MNRFYYLVISIVCVLLLCVGGSCRRGSTLEERIERYVSDKDAGVGVAVMVDGELIAEVNGDRRFPMLSVYKFPLALAVADFCRGKGLDFGDTIDVAAEEMHHDTWSPMREKYGPGSLRVPVRELLAYSLQQSDNNACDILFRLTGGPQTTDSLLSAMGYGDDINVVSTEFEMHADTSLCRDNSATPLAIARLMDEFNFRLRHDGDGYAEIAHMMESCATGSDRIVAPLKGTDAVAGHKTGTGDSDAGGRIIAVNDAAYVNLPGGRRYSLAVFITGSSEGMEGSSRIIADISAMVYEHIVERY